MCPSPARLGYDSFLAPHRGTASTLCRVKDPAGIWDPSRLWASLSYLHSVGFFKCGGHFVLAGSREESSTGPARVLESRVCLGPHSLTGVCRKSPPPPLLPKSKGPSRNAEPTGLVTGGRPEQLLGASLVSAWDLEWASMQARFPARPRRCECGDLMATAAGVGRWPCPCPPCCRRSVPPPHLPLPFLI